MTSVTILCCFRPSYLHGRCVRALVCVRVCVCVRCVLIAWMRVCWVAVCVCICELFLFILELFGCSCYCCWDILFYYWELRFTHNPKRGKRTHGWNVILHVHTETIENHSKNDCYSKQLGYRDKLIRLLKHPISISFGSISILLTTKLVISIRQATKFAVSVLLSPKLSLCFFFSLPDHCAH